MAGITCSVEVAADREQVFEVFTDLAAAPSRVESILRLELLDAGDVGVGTRFRETRMFFNREVTEEMTITAFDPPSAYRVECRSHGALYVSRFRFEPIEEGTRVEVDFQVFPESWFARLMSVFSRMMLSPVRQCTERDLQDLKRAVEAPSD